jgi:hypothetical protein
MELPRYRNRAMYNPGYEHEPGWGHQNVGTPPYRNAPVAGYQKLRMLEYQITAILCPTCHNLNPQKFSTGHKFPNQIEIHLAHFLAASKLGCPFCRLLLQIFQSFVPTAEKYISRASRHNWNLPIHPSDVGIRLVIEPDQPIRVIIREGIEPTASVHAQLLCYNPSGSPPQMLLKAPLR